MWVIIDRVEWDDPGRHGRLGGTDSPGTGTPTFEEDELGIFLRDRIGVENLMWATDYLHPDRTWPEPERVIRDHFQGIDVDDMRATFGGNAARIYGL